MQVRISEYEVQVTDVKTIRSWQVRDILLANRTESRDCSFDKIASISGLIEAFRNEHDCKLPIAAAEQIVESEINYLLARAIETPPE